LVSALRLRVRRRHRIGPASARRAASGRARGGMVGGRVDGHLGSFDETISQPQSRRFASSPGKAVKSGKAYTDMMSGRMQSPGRKMPAVAIRHVLDAFAGPGQLGTPQTSPLVLLPTEILSVIVNLVAGASVKKPDFGNFVRACRRIYTVSLAVLFRGVPLDEKNGISKLRNFAFGSANTDKTSFVRVLRVPHFLNWNKGNLDVLAKCLLHVRHFSFTTRFSKLLGTIWELLKAAPMLTHLELNLEDEAFRSFSESVFPPSVRRLDLNYIRGRNAYTFKRREDPFEFADLARMLNDRAPNLAEIRFN